MAWGTPVSRRLALGGAAGAAASLAVTGCGSESGPRVRRAGEEISLVFWSWVPGIDKPVELWNRENPQVHIELEKVSPDDGVQYAKMHAALKAGDPPDLGQVEFPIIPSFLLDNGLLNLVEYGAEEVRKRFTGWQWNQSVFGDAVFAIPQASGPMGMFVRQDLFDQWGIEVPRTWEAYERAARDVREAGSYIDTFSGTSGDRFAGYAWQNGAKWFSVNGAAWSVTIDDEPTRQVADYWEHLVREKLVLTEPDRRSGWYRHIQTGKIASWLGASWGDALLAGNAQGTSGAWRVHPMPQWRAGEDAYANWGGSTTAVFRGCTYPHDAMDFAVWLNSDPRAVQGLLEGGAGWPAAVDGWQLSDLNQHQEFFGGQRYSTVFAEASKGVDTSWQWGPMTNTLYRRLSDGLTNAIAEGTSFRAVLANVQRQHLEDLRDKGLKARAA